MAADGKDGMLRRIRAAAGNASTLAIMSRDRHSQEARLKKTMLRRRPLRLGGKVYGTNCFESHYQRAKMIRDGQKMGEHSWEWIYAVEWRAGMQRAMKKVKH
jgi:hypothetical protein